MLTLGGPGSRIELDIVGYQFASARCDRWDSEWLQVSGRVESPRGRWTFSDPCLTTFELKGLASWLRKLSAGDANRELGFTEPNLRFVHVEEAAGNALSVWLSQEASPPWATEAERFGEGFALQIPFVSVSFLDAAEAVERLCQKYPERANRSGG
jgi:hypothetical protein